MDEDVWQMALELANKSSFKIDKFLFKQQLDFVRDPAKFATAVCSVRSGKTTACAADLIDTCLSRDGVKALYITLARSSAKRIVWPDLHNIIREFNIPAQFNETELSIKFANGSIIYCSGANTEAETEKLRGLSNVALAYIDESQAFRSHLKGLVEDVLIKRLYDTNGRCRLIGTPGPILGGYFYDCAHSEKWSHHAWTLHNNPHIERKSGLSVNQLIQQDMDRKGVTVDDPAIQRECFGRWMLDSNSLLLEYNAEKNHYDSMPRGVYRYILGIDLGFDDADSLSVIAYTDSSPDTYLVEEIVTEKQLIDELINQCFDVISRYKIVKIVADAGGLGKKIIESIRQRHPIPIEAADKQGKMGNYAILNNALRSGRFKAKKSSRFAQDCNLLEKDRDKSDPERIVVRGHSDAVDSVLYAFKESPAYYFKPSIPVPKFGTPEFVREQELKHEQSAMDQVKKRMDENNARANQFGQWDKDNKGIPSWAKW